MKASLVLIWNYWALACNMVTLVHKKGGWEIDSIDPFHLYFLWVHICDHHRNHVFSLLSKNAFSFDDHLWMLLSKSVFSLQLDFAMVSPTKTDDDVVIGYHHDVILPRELRGILLKNPRVLVCENMCVQSLNTMRQRLQLAKNSSSKAGIKQTTVFYG